MTLVDKPRSSVAPVQQTYGPQRGNPGVDRSRLAERLIAAAVLAALGMHTVLHAGVTIGFALAVLLLPVWVGVLKRFRFLWLFIGASFTTAAWGLYLSEVSSASHSINSSDRLSSTVLLVGTTCGVGVIVWARGVLSAPAIGLWFGLGGTVGAVLAGFTGGNAWKFVYAVPVGIILLSVAGFSRRRSAELLALLALIAISVGSDSRSFAGTFALTAIAVAWQLRRKTATARGPSRLWTTVLLASFSVGVYYVGSTLLVNGYLGSAAQARSIAQIQTSGSLIFGGRPELGATLALMQHHSAGFGVGVVPTTTDIQVAKTGMASLNYAPNNGYVERFMFGGHIELHSVFGDIWANWGIPGLALVALIVFVLISGLAQAIAQRTCSATTLFVVFWSLWNVPFSPLYASAPTLMIALALIFVRKVKGNHNPVASAAQA